MYVCHMLAFFRATLLFVPYMMQFTLYRCISCQIRLI